MKNLRFTRLLLQPSAGGSFGIIMLSLAVMAGAALSFVSNRGLFYDYLFGSGSSAALIETSRSSISLFSEMIFGNPLLNKILFFMFWMVVGLIVYLLISGIGAGAAGAEQALKESGFMHAKRAKISRDLIFRIILRLIALGLLVIYGVLLIRILLPFGILSARIVAGNPGQVNSWYYGALGFIVLVGSFYVSLVLLRFLMLRPRIFGGQEDLIADEIKHSDHQVS